MDTIQQKHSTARYNLFSFCAIPFFAHQIKSVLTQSWFRFFCVINPSFQKKSIYTNSFENQFFIIVFCVTCKSYLWKLSILCKVFRANCHFYFLELIFYTIGEIPLVLVVNKYIKIDNCGMVYFIHQIFRQQFRGVWHIFTVDPQSSRQ